MVYFIGHITLHKKSWIPLTNIPVTLVDLNKDLSSRKISRHTHSIQLVWQPYPSMRPLSDCVIKTSSIKILQRLIRKFLSMRRYLKLPKYILGRETGINPRI